MENKKIFFFSEEINFLLRRKNKLRNWIKACILSEGRDTGFINYIYCSDEYLKDINIKYLKIENYTDVIAFDNSDSPKQISGDIYISIGRIKENSREFETSFYHELYRVMIHGILHLIGYKDKTKKDADLMRKKEDYYLSLLPNFIS
ncbi:MAG: rRNA maturation RNase YbeY [Bacteroidales bacterium]|nr:rRNA maturation RNase YbeY [Bacteroidales bacterium]